MILLSKDERTCSWHLSTRVTIVKCDAIRIIRTRIAMHRVKPLFGTLVARLSRDGSLARNLATHPVTRTRILSPVARWDKIMSSSCTPNCNVIWWKFDEKNISVHAGRAVEFLACSAKFLWPVRVDRFFRVCFCWIVACPYAIHVLRYSLLRVTPGQLFDRAICAWQTRDNETFPSSVLPGPL